MPSLVQITVGELFAGAGGLGLGFILAKHPSIIYKPVFAVDNDPNSVKTYTRNMQWLMENAPGTLPSPPKVFEKDAETLKVSALLRGTNLKKGGLDLLLGGPPCQGFSTSNRRAKEKQKIERNRLVKVFFDRLNDFRPKMFLLENVQGVRWTKPTEEMKIASSQPLFDDLPIKPLNVQEYAIHRARELGYRVWWSILDAVDYGVPQHRPRFFLFGVRKDLIESNQHVNLPIPSPVESKVTVWEAIGDLPKIGNGKIWEGECYEPGTSAYVKVIRQLMKDYQLFDHVTTNHAPYVIERYKKIPQGSNWLAIKDDMTNYSKVDNTHSNIYRRLRASKPAHTISHYRKSMVIHPYQHRGLSMREACRLQSFPDWFRFEGGSDEQQQQLANAVPPLMASAVASGIAYFYHNVIHKKSKR